MATLLRSNGGGIDLDDLTTEEKRQAIDNLLIGGSGWTTITTARNTTFTATRRSLVVGCSWGHGTSGGGAGTSTTGTQLDKVAGGLADWDGAGGAGTSLMVAVVEAGQTVSFSGWASDNGRYAYGSIAAYKPID